MTVGMGGTSSPGQALLRFLWWVIWAIKFSLASVLLGLFVFSMRTQLTNLLIASVSPIRWVAVLALFLLAWAIPVHNSASRALARVPRVVVRVGVRLVEFSGAGGSPIGAIVPLLLGVAPLVILLTALWSASQDLQLCEHIGSVRQLEICQGFASAADLAAIQSPSFQPAPSVSVPEVADALSELWLASILTVAAIVLFLLYAVIPPMVSAGAARQTRPASGVFRRFVATRWNLVYAAAAGVLLGWAFFDPLGFCGALSGVAVIPVLLGCWVPFASLFSELDLRIRAPVILVIAVLVATAPFLGRYHDVRLFRSVEWERAKADSEANWATPRQLFLREAIARWQTANDCGDDAGKCPPVVLVAIEGGGSRAAFFASTVLGALLDATRRDPEAYFDLARVTFALSGVSGGALGAATLQVALRDADGTRPPCKVASPHWFGAGSRYAPAGARQVTDSWRACLQALTTGDYLSAPIVGLALRDLVPAISPNDRGVLLEQAIESHYNGIVGSSDTPCGGREDRRGFCRPLGYLPQPSVGHWLPLLLLAATSVETGHRLLMSDLRTAAVDPSPDNCTALSILAHSVFELLASNARKSSEPVTSKSPSCDLEGLTKAPDIRLSTAVGLSARAAVVLPAATLRFEDPHYGQRGMRLVDGAYFDNSGLETLREFIPFLLQAKLHPVVILLSNTPWYSHLDEDAERLLASAGSQGRPTHSLDNLLDTYARHPDGSAQSHALVLNTFDEPRVNLAAGFMSPFMEPVEALFAAYSAHLEMSLAEMGRTAISGAFEFIPIRVMQSIALSAAAGRAGSLCLDRPDPGPTSRLTLYQPVMSLWLSPLAQRTLDAQLCDRDNERAIANILALLRRQGGLAEAAQR